MQRKRLAGIVAAVVVAIALVVVLVVATGGNGARNRPAAASSSSPATPAATGSTSPAATSSAPAPSAAVPSAPSVAGMPPSLPPVALTKEAAVGNGVTARVSSIKSVTASASGRGNVDGPALEVHVRITNGTAKALSLDEVEVALFYTEQDTSASPVADRAGVPFQGTLEPGASAEGTYAFTVPADERDHVTVTVGYTAGAPLLVFSGPVS